jgi:hypothetical protein
MARIDRCWRRRVGSVGVGLSALLLGACHLPWRHGPPPPPAAVNELTESAETGTSADYPQYWKRNTLLVDLRSAPAQGGLVLQPRSGTQWPVRVAFRVTPGSIGVLEVRGASRIVLPVATGGGPPIDLELPPGLYSSKTPNLMVHWSPH